MTEDAQPNERRRNGKGSAIPVIRPTRATSRGHRGGYGIHYQRLSNHSQSRTHPSISPSNHQQSFYLKRPQISHDTPSPKRRQTELADFDSRSQPASHPRPRPPPKPTIHNSKPFELVVELPSNCRKGSPDCHRLRREWLALQLQDLSTTTGVSLRIAGYSHDTARFLARNPGEVGVRQANQETPPHAPIPTEPSVALLPETSTNNVFNEPIISGHIHAQNNSASILASSLNRSATTNLSRRLDPLESTDKQAQETHKIFPVFRSGVLSVSSKDSSRRSSSSKQTPIVVSEGTRTVPLSKDGVTDYAQVQEEVASMTSAKLQETIAHSSPLCQPIQASNNYYDDHGSNDSPNRCTLASEDVSIRIPLSPSDKIRRIMHMDGNSIISASMRSSVDLFTVEPLRYQRSIKSQKTKGLVDDACIVKVGDEFLVIFGHARDQEQLSWCYSRPTNAQCDVRFLVRPWNSTKKGGVSAVAAMMHAMQFATGGYDHAVHLWDIKPDLSEAFERPLAIKHTSQVQSLLAIRDTSHKLLSAGADCNVHIWDLSSERVVNTLKPSNATYHLHATTSPFCTLLEVAHRELQFEVRDHRLIPQHPVLRFGYSTDKVHGRFIKGAATSEMFACGSRDGSIRLWDMRNTKSVATKTADCGQKIVQVIFEKGHLIACGETGQTSLFKYGRDLNA